jgi:mannose-6-phosphate isomerase-like protein (cupin superfamily)
VDVRRVVTGHDSNGKAVFVRDDIVRPIGVSMLPGVEFLRVWGADTPPQFPDNGAVPVAPTYFPPITGFRVALFTLPPRGADDPLPQRAAGANAVDEFEAKLPGLIGYLEPDAPGMHTTPTIDFDLVLAGEVILELDNSATKTLKPGDIVVQNGTRHRWRNEGTVAATLAVFICGAHHAKFQDEPNGR